MVVCVKMMSKGSKEALTVLIVTHVTHVEKVESGVCGLCTQYRYIQCYVERVKRSLNSFNCYPCYSCHKKFWKAETYHPMLCMSKHVEGSKVKITFDPFDIHSIGWYFWKGLSLSFPKLFAD